MSAYNIVSVWQTNCYIAATTVNVSTEHLDKLSSEIIIASKDLRLLDCIGQGRNVYYSVLSYLVGEFGLVYKAHLIRSSNNYQPITVAVKTLKGMY